MSGVTASDTNLEREKWQADLRLRERELSLKEDGLRFKHREVHRSRWANPLVLAVLAAALAAAGNAAVAHINGTAQRELEVARTTSQETIEETKAEAARILEVIKTDPKVALQNLAFLVDVGLITNPERRAAITEYLKKTPPGQGPSLSVWDNWLNKSSDGIWINKSFGGKTSARKNELMKQLSEIDTRGDPAEVMKKMTSIQLQIQELDKEEEAGSNIVKGDGTLKGNWTKDLKN